MTEFSIYQINMDRDAANVCFIGMESLEKIKGTKEVNAAAYDRVYDGKMDCMRLMLSPYPRMKPCVKPKAVCSAWKPMRPTGSVGRTPTTTFLHSFPTTLNSNARR